MSRHGALDEDDDGIGGAGYRIPDKDVYRRMITSFSTAQNYFQNRMHVRTSRDRLFLQPHFTSLRKLESPFGGACQADGVCAHFLRRGLIKPAKTQMTTAVWSADARWLVLGTVAGSVAIWEGDTLKVHKVASLTAHVDFDGNETIIKGYAITAMAWNNHGNVLVTADERGLIQISDETFRETKKIPEAHTGHIRGLSYSPSDSRLVSCGDDHMLHIWSVGMDVAAPKDCTLQGHQSDVKCVDWHPYRGLIASGSRDTSVRLWDAKQGVQVSVLSGHKKQVNACAWNQNGNWLASGSKDGLVKIFDIRTMREIEVLRGHNSDVCSLAWHPHHEQLLLSGGYNGSLIYWLAAHNQAPHTIVKDAHRQSIDIIAWHPAGHCVSTASHDGILKFWSREAPGARLETEVKEFQDNPEVAYGPLKVGAPSVIPPPGAPFVSSGSTFPFQQPYMSGSTGGTIARGQMFDGSASSRMGRDRERDRDRDPLPPRSNYQRGGAGSGGGGVGGRGRGFEGVGGGATERGGVGLDWRRTNRFSSSTEERSQIPRTGRLTVGGAPQAPQSQAPHEREEYEHLTNDFHTGSTPTGSTPQNSGRKRAREFF